MNSSNKFDLVCIGEATIDIFCNGLPDIPRSGEWVVVDSMDYHLGGCPANTAVVASKLNLKTRLISNIGNDVWGDILLEELKKNRVSTNNINKIGKYNTGKTIVLNIKNKDRTMIHDNGANVTLDINHINRRTISSSRSVLLSSYISALPKLLKKDVIELYRYLKDLSILTFLDVLIDPFTKDPVIFLEGLLEYTDYLIINEDEGELITGLSNYKEQARALLGINANNVIIKLGKDGSYFCNNEFDFESRPYKVKVKDPTGSGDAFNAGVIYGCLQKWDIKKVLRFANIVGASAVTEVGCTSGIYSLKKIKEIMKENW